MEITKSVATQIQSVIINNFKWIGGETEPEIPEGYTRAPELDLDFGDLGKLWGFVEVV